MSEKSILFDKSAKKELLSFFGKIEGTEGYVVEKDNPTQRVLSPDGEEVKIEKFAAIIKGSEAFIESDLISLLRLADKF